MKKIFLTLAAVVSLVAVRLPAQDYKLNFVPSPDETNGTVQAYVGLWAYTNYFTTNSTGTNWVPFTSVPAGSSNLIINATVPSPAYLVVAARGTNQLLSAPTNRIYFSRSALALIYTNQPAPPRPPGTNFLSN